MKKIMVGVLTFSLWVAVCIDVPQFDIDVVNDIVVNHEVWLKGAWSAKVNRSKDRMIQKEIQRSHEEGNALDFSDSEKMIKGRLNRSGYKNREQRGK